MTASMQKEFLNTADYTFGLPDIITHRQEQKSDSSDNLPAQARLLRKWEAQRSKLHSFTKMDPEAVKAWQLERIALLVDFAFSNHPFYHQLYKGAGYRRGDLATWADYYKLPTVSKTDIVENYDLFTKHLIPNASEVYAPRTSGSSGMVLTALFDAAALDQDLMQCLRFAEQMLGREREISEWLYQIYLVSPQLSSLEGRYPTFTVSHDCPPESVLEHIRRLKPAILSGLPSSLYKVAQLIEDPNELGLKAINTNSEPSTKAERSRLSRLFGAPVFDEYSSVELCLIATECAEGKYHIVEDSVRLDVLNPDDSGAGEVVATSLNNFYMPFIRYRHSDIVRINDSPEACACGCGSRSRHITEFMGRQDQFLFSKTQGQISSDRVMSLYDRAFLSFDANIKEFKIIQTEADSISLLFVPIDPSQDISRQAIEIFEAGIKDLLGSSEIKLNIQIVDHIPPGKNHKRRIIENNIPTGPQ